MSYDLRFHFYVERYSLFAENRSLVRLMYADIGPWDSRNIILRDVSLPPADARDMCELLTSLNFALLYLVQV